MNNRRNRIRTIVSLSVAAVLLMVTAFIVVNRQYVADAISVWHYTPSTEIAQITERTSFTDSGRFYFYASAPSVERAEAFNDICTRQESGSAILGCYTAGRIVIYDVTNTQLDGIEEVTAAHETLHAVWDRLDDNERSRIGTLLEAEFTRIKNTELEERMAYYERTEPGQRANELHSIIGTEFATLSPELEAHYAMYFKDRSAVVALHASYQSVFDTLSAQSDTLEQEIAVLKSALDIAIAAYNADSQQITKEVAALKVREASVDRTNAAAVNAYNATRQALLVRLDALDESRRAINADTDAYNAKITAYNELVVRTNELTKSLDSTLQATPSL